MSTKSLSEFNPNDLTDHEKNVNLRVLDAAEVEDIAVQDGVSAIYEAKCRLSTLHLQSLRPTPYSLLSLFPSLHFRRARRYFFEMSCFTNSFLLPCGAGGIMSRSVCSESVN